MQQWINLLSFLPHYSNRIIIIIIISSILVDDDNITTNFLTFIIKGRIPSQNFFYYPRSLPIIIEKQPGWL
jgi:hypothetical protein